MSQRRPRSSGSARPSHRSRRSDVSIAGLCREAVDRALADAGLAPGRHRRGRGREGARPVRGRDDARAVPGRRARRHRQAAAAGAHGGLGRRGDRERRGQPGPGRPAPPGARGRVREAVGVQRHVGAVDHAAVQHAGAGRRGRVLRAAHPRLHPPQRRARAHRRAGRGQGPAQRQPQPVRAPAAAGHHAGVGARLPHAVGPGPLRRDLPVLGRRVRGDHRRPGGRPRPPRPAAGRWPGSGRPRCAPSRPCSRARTTSTPGRAPTAPPRCGARPGITSPIDEIDVAEIYVPFSWFEPMWLENLGFAGPGEGWRLTEAGETRDRRARCRSTRPAGCSAPTRSGPPACCGSPRPRCRSWARPGDHQVRRGPDRARPRLRRRLAVLLHVGGGGHPGLSAPGATATRNR